MCVSIPMLEMHIGLCVWNLLNRFGPWSKSLVHFHIKPVSWCFPPQYLHILSCLWTRFLKAQMNNFISFGNWCDKEKNNALSDEIPTHHHPDWLRIEWTHRQRTYKASAPEHTWELQEQVIFFNNQPYECKPKSQWYRTSCSMPTNLTTLATSCYILHRPAKQKKYIKQWIWDNTYQVVVMPKGSHDPL